MTSASPGSSSRTRRPRLPRPRSSTRTRSRKAAALILDDQLADGSWQLDSSDSIGSPATYGTALATVFSRRTIVAAGAPAGSRAAAAVARADAWLAGIRPSNAPDAAAVLFAAADAAPPTRPANVDLALGFFARGQGRNGGWGPYLSRPRNRSTRRSPCSRSKAWPDAS